MNLDQFIAKNVTLREQSMLTADIDKNRKQLQEAIEGKRVLVIGGAGSIGSSYIKAILPFRPASLVVVDTNENGLTELTRDLRSTKDLVVPEDYVPYPMDYSSRAFRRMFIDRKGFDIVANFSAHKHVRSEKDIYSIEAMIYNNLIHARELLNLMCDYPPDVYFCVSTDKAANPVNIMGASKRIMEDLIFSYSDKFPVRTARFANVAFSNGSLPAGFLDRIRKLQPLSTPGDVQRYFVSPEESGQICMMSCMLGNNREIYFPKLNESQMMRFDQIALRLLEENGYHPLPCNTEQEALEKAEALRTGGLNYPVLISKSDTSGEKMYEEFYTEEESVALDRYDSLGVVLGKEIPDVERLKNMFNRLENAFDTEGVIKNDIVRILEDYMPTFRHIESNKSLDQKM